MHHTILMDPRRERYHSQPTHTVSHRSFTHKKTSASCPSLELLLHCREERHGQQFSPRIPLSFIPSFASSASSQATRYTPAMHRHRSSRQKKPAAPKPTVPRPNFFVGYRINEPSIIQRVAELQQRVLERVPEAGPCMVDHRSIHVTLCMIHLADQDAIDQAMVILREHMRTVAAPVFSADLPVFEVKGLGFFGSNDILHCQVDTTSSHALHMAHVAESLYNAFKAAGFAPHPFKLPYSPHVTIWKSTKDHAHIKQMNTLHGRRGYLQDTLYNDLVQNESEAMTGHFGYERPVSVEVLKMLEKEPDGYYRSYGSVSILDTTAPPEADAADATTEVEAADEALAKLSLAPTAAAEGAEHP